MQVRLTVLIEAPDGTTHYSGDLLDEPGWWKRQTNSTGVITAWYCARYRRNGAVLWYYEGEHEPHFLKPLNNIGELTWPNP